MAFGDNILPLGPNGEYPKPRFSSFNMELPYLNPYAESKLPAREKNFVKTSGGPASRVLVGFQRKGINQGGMFVPRYSTLSGYGLGTLTAKQQQALAIQQAKIEKARIAQEAKLARARAQYAWKMEQARMAEALRAEKAAQAEAERQKKLIFLQQQKETEHQRKLERKRLLPDIKTQRQAQTQQFQLEKARMAQETAFEKERTKRDIAYEKERAKVDVEVAKQGGLERQTEYMYKSIVESKQAEADAVKMFAPPPMLQDNFYGGGNSQVSVPSQQQYMEYPQQQYAGSQYDQGRQVDTIETQYNPYDMYYEAPAPRSSGPEMAEEYYEPFVSQEQFSPYDEMSHSY